MERRHPFIQAIIILVTFIVLEGISLLLITRNSIIQRYAIMEGIETIRTFFLTKGYNASYYLSLRETNDRLAAENLKLREENGLLNGKLSIYQDTIRTFRDTAQFSYISALVVRNSTDKQHNIIILNKGSLDGVKEDMGVITARGVIGHVLSVSKHYSRVVSLLDIDQGISAIIKSNGTFGSLKWDGTDISTATLHDIPVHTEITPGDTIVTSGYSSIFPAGVILGTIISSDIHDGINYEVKISIAENFSSLSYVYIVDNNDKEEVSL